MIMEKVLAAAEPYLAGKKVCDLVIGLSLIGCQLDNGDVGVSYVLREELPHGCSAFPYAQEVIGKPAAEIAGWALSGCDNVQRAIAASVLVAASCGQEIADDDITDRPFGIEVGPDDIVGMVGLISPVAMQLSRAAKELIIFDRGVSLHNKNAPVYPVEKQPELLPGCDIVILSGTTTINGSIDALLEMCSNAREVVMVGPSTPMFPRGWQGSRLTRLAGSWWDKEHKDEIFKLISLACGIRHLLNYMRKKVAAVK
jgi:uncharacterized protein (DUF4213/DUF364 family)